jgi:hypothetical protein
MSVTTDKWQKQNGWQRLHRPLYGSATRKPLKTAKRCN